VVLYHQVIMVTYYWKYAHEDNHKDTMIRSVHDMIMIMNDDGD
jgi:hypothetical protein